MKTVTQNGDREREKFFEGASWNAKQAVKACDEGLAKNGKASEEYKIRIKECDQDHFMRLRAAEWLLDSTNRIVKEIRDENQQFLENAIRSNAGSLQMMSRQI